MFHWVHEFLWYAAIALHGRTAGTAVWCIQSPTLLNLHLVFRLFCGAFTGLCPTLKLFCPLLKPDEASVKLELSAAFKACAV
mmetsp:Transcript_7080/g.10634  ORF Transcript_7080/g.10634 Transcript_7080/m.10634 type:complete len:82 (+) Transcript_7080:89-334(+)